MNDYQNYEDMGGYTVGDNQDTAAAAAAAGGRNQKKTLTPLTIKQLSTLENHDTVAILPEHGMQVAYISIVGKVSSVEPKTSHVEFRVEDGTGAMTVKYWRSSGEQGTEGDEELMGHNASYCKFVGTVNFWNNTVELYAYKVTPVVDSNQITTHMLDAIYVVLAHRNGPLEIPQYQPQGQQKQQQQSGFQQGAHQQQQQQQGDQSSFSDNALADAISSVVMASSTGADQRGVHINTIIDNLRGRWNDQMIRIVVSELANNGDLYATAHPDCYKKT